MTVARVTIFLFWSDYSLLPMCCKQKWEFVILLHTVLCCHMFNTVVSQGQKKSIVYVEIL